MMGARERGGIGRRAGFRSRSRKRWEFESPRSHCRYPDGVTKPGFWHKEVPDHAPAWIARWHCEEAEPGETQCYVVVDRPATLAWMANFGAIDLHAWTSRIDAPDRPTYALIDVDPGEKTGWDDVRTLVDLYRAALDHLSVRGYPKVTGGRGVQIWVPIATGPTFGQTRAWVESLSHAIGDLVPELVSRKWEKRGREGLARLDYTQNAVNKTLVAPYCVRPAAGAPVSMPVTWDEMDDRRLRSDRWTIRDAGRRLLERGDLFAGALDFDQQLPAL